MKNIEWTKWSAVAEILSAIAIVVTLIYLAAQTQHLAEQTAQNNVLMHAQARAARIQSRRVIYETVASNPDVSRVYASEKVWGELTQDQVIALSMNAIYLIGLESL